MSWPAKTRDFRARGCDGRPVPVEDGVVIWPPGVKLGTDEASGMVFGGAGTLKDEMLARGVPLAEKGAVGKRRPCAWPWPPCDDGGGRGGRGSCPWGWSAGAWAVGTTACLMFWTSWTSSSNLLLLLTRLWDLSTTQSSLSLAQRWQGWPGTADELHLTLESRHDTHAVFLLMRVWGEDCSAAEASRSRDSLDSPASFMSSGSVSVGNGTDGFGIDGRLSRVGNSRRQRSG